MKRDTFLGRLFLLVACLAMAWDASVPWYWSLGRAGICLFLIREWAFSWEER